MQLPADFLTSIKELPGFDEEAFISVHQNPEPLTSVRINPLKIKDVNIVFPASDAIPWTDLGYYLKERPSFTFDPLFHAGAYYVQEASSMFLEHALKQLVDLSSPLRILDLSAAPGGKSTHIQSLISEESILVSNEVIRNRAMILKDNIIKWGANNVIVTNNDPSVFSKMPGYFDVIVVDAPCSGSGLFRKDPDAVNEWSLNNVNLCSQRQQRILASALPALRENGLLIYSTCSYSKEEDEMIGDWLVEEMEMKTQRLDIPQEWNIVETEGMKTGAKGYRFYPDKLKGEGFFMSCFTKSGSTGRFNIKPAKMEKISADEKKILEKWMLNENEELIREHGIIYAIPAKILNDVALCRQVLNIQYMGTRIGEIMHKKLVPDHALALSSLLNEGIPSTELEMEDAIKYLQRMDVNIKPVDTGWQTVNYKGFKLGWINALVNRINNYYPKELRILKQQKG